MKKLKLSQGEIEAANRYAKGDKKKLRDIKRIFLNQKELGQAQIDFITKEANEKRKGLK